MKLFEYQGKAILQSNGIPIPQGMVCRNEEEVRDISQKIKDVVLKIQILSGKRGKAGGIKFASNPEEAVQAARFLLGQRFGEHEVAEILVEEKLAIEKEFYLAVTYDYQEKRPLLLASAHGGMDIEEVPEEHIIKRYLKPDRSLELYEGRDISISLGVKDQLPQLASILVKAVDTFIKCDAELVEINPLVLSGNKFIAADAKIVIDDDALYRHPDLPKNTEKTDIEQKSHEIGLSYVELDGDIAIMANGAGITMATLDLIQSFGGKPANFLDAGGGASEDQTRKALELLLATNPKGILINIFGGITRCDDVARAFLAVKAQLAINIPVVIRLVGTNQKEALELLKASGIEAHSDMEIAAKTIVDMVRGA